MLGQAYVKWRLAIARQIPGQKEKISEPEPVPESVSKQKNESTTLNEPSSMTSLIIWNVSKAREMEPCMDLKGSIRAAMHRLDSATSDLSILNEEHPEQQHLVCALLAWQQLGHHGVDSLHRFIESKEIEMRCDDDKRVSKSNNDNKYQNNIHGSIKSINVNRDPAAWKIASPLADGSFGSYTSGPVVKLPTETKIIMRCGADAPSCREGPRRPTKRSEKTMNKIDAACNLDSGCAEKLASLGSTTNELRARTSQLARREAERVELLERAEAAWRELERGYQRRISLAEEKEEDLRKIIEKCISDRTEFKKSCGGLTVGLKNMEVVIETARENLTTVEKQVCSLASAKMQLSEEAAKSEACVSEQMCKAAQFDRDLKFKEEQARRKLEVLENEAMSARALTCEAERAMRAELAGLREQISAVSKELLQEDEANLKIKQEHDNLRKEKAELIQNLDGCKEICDKKMQGQLDELMKKKEKVLELQEQALECRCKLPVDRVVQVKRTPSLAAMCQCAPEDHILESCSCTSLRGRILTTLLADLFGGLQHELSGTGTQMPCQLLKCLEDKHNWDRSSVTKTNLRNFFSNLLKSELDIAIASSIENYHAKWVGATCADVAKMKPTLDDDLKEGWQERAIEKRAHKMATRLAEDLFQERSEQMEKRAMDIMRQGPPPCECGPPVPNKEAAVYPCLMPTNTAFNREQPAVTRSVTVKDSPPTPPPFWKETIQDVTQLKHQIEDLAKDSLKKEDLKVMEENIFKIVKQASVLETEETLAMTKDTSKCHGETVKKGSNVIKMIHKDIPQKSSNQNKSESIKRKALDNKSLLKKGSINEKPSKQSKKPGHGRSYAVNLCLCGAQKNGKALQNAQLSNSGKSLWKQRPVRDIKADSSNVKQTKPININLLTSELPQNGGIVSEDCSSNCKCFHKMPSNTSIDKLLQTLASWKYDSADSRRKCVGPIKSILSKSSKTAINDDIDQNDPKMNYSFTIANNKKHVNGSVSYDDTLLKMNKQHRPFEQPATTESEYMGTVFLDKSRENICKCVTNIDYNRDSNQEIYEDGNKNVPVKYINTNACVCSIHEEMVKDHKRSQTDELQKVEVQSNHCQAVESKDLREFQSSLKSLKSINSPSEMKKMSELKDVSQKPELFSSNGEHYITFLGVTLNDLRSNKKSYRKQKMSEFLISKEKLDERQKKLSKKLSKKLTDDEQINVLTKPNVKTNETNDLSEITDTVKCECIAKFEEFKSCMDSLINNNLNKTTHKDEVVDSQSLKYIGNTIESCDCCSNTNIDNSKDLEVNAFHLLEDHIKGKLEEFKLFSCKAQCLPPEEEKKLFSTIKQRVKQVISDCANKLKCQCSGEFPNNTSWNRAYGLLQEYLKMKIQRVQCLCVSDDSKDVLLPEILDKVCNLIENDFERLKDICHCKNSNETPLKGPSIQDLVLFSKELPEKDTNTSQAKYNDVEVENLCSFTKSSKQNSNNSMILKENISSQVPPNLGMEAKSCDIMKPFDKNAITTETDYIVTNSKSNGVMYNTCDCCYNTDKVDIRKFPDMFGTKEVFVNLYSEQAINTNDLCEFPKIGTTQEPPRCLSKDRVESMMELKPTKIEISQNDKSKLDASNKVDVQTPNVPYIGYTVDCSCDGALGSCFCVKSVVQANNDKINSLWKGYLVNNNNNQDFSYIMHGTQKENSNSNPGDVIINKTTTEPVQNDGPEEITLKYSLDNIDYSENAVNTVHESVSSETSNDNFIEISPIDWIRCPVPVNSGRSNAVNLTNSIYYPGLPINNDKNLISTMATGVNDIQKQSQMCDCNKVPICHVKMLVEHIEKNLIEAKCTCDSLISKVCPVHSKRVF